MRDPGPLEEFLNGAWVDSAVFSLRPDYRAVLLAVDGLVPGPSDDASESLLKAAQTCAHETLERREVVDLPQVAAWREAYKSFGAKPQRTRSSLESLLRRAPSGLPRVNRLTDIYNAISVLHQIPLGGEDLNGYTGAPRPSAGHLYPGHPADRRPLHGNRRALTHRAHRCRDGRRRRHPAGRRPPDS